MCNCHLYGESADNGHREGWQDRSEARAEDPGPFVNGMHCCYDRSS